MFSVLLILAFPVSLTAYAAGGPQIDIIQGPPSEPTAPPCTIIFTVSDTDGVSSINVNGRELGCNGATFYDADWTTRHNGNINITATDNLGNQSSITVTVNTLNSAGQVVPQPQVVPEPVSTTAATPPPTEVPTTAAAPTTAVPTTASIPETPAPRPPQESQPEPSTEMPTSASESTLPEETNDAESTASNESEPESEPSSETTSGFSSNVELPTVSIIKESGVAETRFQGENNIDSNADTPMEEPASYEVHPDDTFHIKARPLAGTSIHDRVSENPLIALVLIACILIVMYNVVTFISNLYLLNRYKKLYYLLKKRKTAKKEGLDINKNK